MTFRRVPSLYEAREVGRSVRSGVPIPDLAAFSRRVRSASADYQWTPFRSRARNICSEVGVPSSSSPRAAAESGIADPVRTDEASATTELDRLLRDAVKMRTLADVPVGVFLSGGIDSSTIVALMQAQSARPIKSFSIGILPHLIISGVVLLLVLAFVGWRARRR